MSAVMFSQNKLLALFDAWLEIFIAIISYLFVVIRLVSQNECPSDEHAVTKACLITVIKILLTASLIFASSFSEVK